MPRIAAALAALVVVFCLSSAAQAEHQRVAVLGSDAELARAISLALSPWGLETTSSAARAPGPSQPGAVREATLLAERLEVDALIWLTPADGGSLLWVLDVDTGDVTTRLVPQTSPFDGAGAAAVALSVKTVLRASAIAPPNERFGSSTRSRTPQVVFALEGGALVHWMGEHAVEPRAQLEGVLWHSTARRLGLSLHLASGPGLQVDAAAFRGRYRELTLGGSARVGLWRGSVVSTSVAAGGSARWTTLEGTLTSNARAAQAQRLNASVDLRAVTDFRVSDRVYLGVAIGGAYLPRYRRYLVLGEPVFGAWPFSASLAAHCGVELF
jgi:hypothetical protein